MKNTLKIIQLFLYCSIQHFATVPALLQELLYFPLYCDPVASWVHSHVLIDLELMSYIALSFLDPS